jgi:alpha/beta superfamily hydrolase
MLLGRAVILIILAAVSAAAQEHTKITTQDGAVIYADLYGKGDRGVVLAHGGQFTKESWAKQAQTLADAGFRVLAFDFRGFGQSPRPRGSKGEFDGVQYDVLAAVRYLHDHGAKTVSVVGGSFGGWAAAQASVESKAGEIDRLVLLAAFSVDEPQKIKGRKLFIVARDDAEANEPRLPGIQQEYDKTPEPKKLIVVDGSAHAQFLFETAQGERVMQEILRFLSEP